MKLEQTAIHEAGHAVVGYVLKLPYEELALTHDTVDESGAYGHAISPNPQYGYEHASRRERNKAMRDACTACCAGLAAEHVFFGVPLSTDNKYAQGDFSNIIELERDGLRIPRKSGGTVGDEETWRYISRLLLKAKKLVNRHRNEIQLLADALVKARKLSKDDVARLLSKLIPRHD